MLNWVKEPGRRVGAYVGSSNIYDGVHITSMIEVEGGYRALLWLVLLGGAPPTYHATGSAFSPDGLNWVMEPGRRIGATAADADLQKTVAFARINEIPGGYRAYFGALDVYPQPNPDDDTHGYRVKSAISPDGLNWVVEPGRPIDRGAPYSGHGRSVPNNDLIDLGDGHFRMIVTSVEPDAYFPDTFALRSAITTDGLFWQIEPSTRASCHFLTGANYSTPMYSYSHVENLDSGCVRVFTSYGATATWGPQADGIITLISSDGGLNFTQEPGLRLHEEVNEVFPFEGGYRLYAHGNDIDLGGFASSYISGS